MTDRRTVQAALEHEQDVTTNVPTSSKIDDVINHNIEGALEANMRKPSRKKTKSKGAQICLVEQLEPSSYLGRLFTRKSRPSGNDDRDSSPSPEPSDTTEEESDSDSSTSAHHSKLVSAKKHKVRKLVHKPVKPEVYDGWEDAEAFHKFVCQVTEYIEGYDIDRSMHVSTASNFMSGKAYRFFVNTVSGQAGSYS